MAHDSSALNHLEVGEGSLLLPRDDETIVSKEWNLKSKLGGALFAATVLFSGAAIMNSSSAETTKNNELLVEGNEDVITHSLIVQRKGYSEMSKHTLGIYGYDFLAEPDATSILTVSTCTDCTDLTWTIESLDERGSVTYEESTTNTLHAVFGSANTKYSVKVVNKDSKVLLDVVVNSKYVRRELRTLQVDDLKTFFEALKVMYTTSQEEGQALYGDDYLSYAHLTALHADNDYKYHANLFFLTSHPVMQIKFEKSLLAIDKTSVLTYWDFLIDYDLGRDWASSRIYDSDMFGAVKTSADDDYRVKGYFHDVKLVSDPDYTAFPRAQHSPRGFLGNELMTASSDYLQRSNTYCGFESVQGQVSCSNLVSCFSEFESANNLRQFDECLELTVHANLHMMHAGQWDCAESWSDFYEERKVWLDEMLFSILAVRMSSESLKAHGLAGDLSCPTSCTSGESCECTSAVTGITTADDIHLLDKNTKFDYLKSAWSTTAKISVGGSDFIKLQDTYEMDGVTHHNVFVPLDTKGEGATGKAMDNDKLDELNTLLMKTILFPGKVGVMLSGAAPTDPLFWVMHPLFDKAVHAVRLSSNYNSEGFDWNNNKGDMKFNGVTPFTHLDFEPYLGGDIADAKTFMTNSELWDNLHPSADSVYYVYDQFTSWGSCSFDPFGGTDDSTEADD